MFTVLRDQIVRGQYRAGTMIPKEEELCALFGVSRITVRRALADLEAEGLVEKRQGKGTFVRLELPAMRPMATLGFLDSLRQISDETKVEVLSLERQEAGGDIAHLLNVEEATPLLHAMRLRRKASVPVMITEAWVPEACIGEVKRADLEKQPMFELLMERGIRFDRVVQEFTAIAASPEHARLLQVPPGQPLVGINRLIYDEQQQPVQYLTVVMSPERSRVLMDIAIGAMNTLAAGTIVHDVAT
jgi:GntR family transcriptional regulator